MMVGCQFNNQSNDRVIAIFISCLHLFTIFLKPSKTETEFVVLPQRNESSFSLDNRLGVTGVGERMVVVFSGWGPGSGQRLSSETKALTFANINFFNFHLTSVH